MGHVSRHEVGVLVEKFETRVIPKEMSLGMPGILLGGIAAVKKELQSTQGAPSVLLRNYARVLKHYSDLPKDPRNIHYANHAIAAVGNGQDVTKSIKRARSEVDLSVKESELRRAVKRISGLPNRNDCLAALA